GERAPRLGAGSRFGGMERASLREEELEDDLARAPRKEDARLALVDGAVHVIEAHLRMAACDLRGRQLVVAEAELAQEREGFPHVRALSVEEPETAGAREERRAGPRLEPPPEIEGAGREVGVDPPVAI